MRLVNGKYGIAMNFEENRTQCLLVEQKNAMADIVNDLYRQCEGGEGSFVLQEQEKELKMSKCADFILEPFSLSVNSKKNINQLYASMSTYCNDSQYQLKSEINQKVIQLVDEAGLVLSYDISFDMEILPESIFKAINVKFNEEYTLLKEKLIQYISIVSSLNSSFLLIFLHLRSFLDKNDLQEVYECAYYHKIHLLCIENAIDDKINGEKYCIIDKDLCIIES